jgi:hypothetical protein
MKVAFFIGKNILNTISHIKTINTLTIPQLKEKILIDNITYIVNDICTIYDDISETIEIAVEEYSE